MRQCFGNSRANNTRLVLGAYDKARDVEIDKREEFLSVTYCIARIWGEKHEFQCKPANVSEQKFCLVQKDWRLVSTRVIFSRPAICK